MSGLFVYPATGCFIGRKCRLPHVSLQMPRSYRPSVPTWKQAIAIACALYFLIVWIAPLFMLPFVNELPFVQEHDIYERLMFSAIGTLSVMGVLVSLGPKTLWRAAKLLEPNGSQLRKLGHWAGVIGGLSMFTFFAALLSGNTLGLISSVLPSQPYKEIVVLDSVEFNGAKYRSASLRYTSEKDGKPRYLVISKRLFEYPKFAPGDVLELHGEQGLVGVYITGFRREG